MAGRVLGKAFGAINHVLVHGTEGRQAGADGGDGEVSTKAQMAGYVFTQLPSVREMLLTAMTRTILIMQMLKMWCVRAVY